MRQGTLGLAVLMTVAAGCTSTVKLPDLGLLYDEAAQRHERWRNPVIVIPGIMGSRLVDGATGQVAWGAFSGDFADPRDANGARTIALPMKVDVPLAELRDSIVSDGALDRVRLRVFGLPYVHAAYTYILGTLGVGGYRDQALGQSGAIDYGTEHYTCFQFHYDWRRDLAESAARLGRFLEERAELVRRENLELYGVDEPVQFDVVAHSMGGLVLRYFLRYGTAPLPEDGSLPELTWAGAQLVERALLIGTPNAGSLEALHQLVEGTDLGPFIPDYPPAVLGTMPAVYQLLPRGRHGMLVEQSSGVDLDPLDPQTWDRLSWGLSDPTQAELLAALLPDVTAPAERTRIARAHRDRCLRRARQVQAALDRPAARPTGLELYLFAGDAEPTGRRVAVEPGSDSLGRGAACSLVDLETAPGDGTVLRSSALMDERLGEDWHPRLHSPIDWTQVLFLFTDHLGMTRDPAFADNALFILLEDPRDVPGAQHRPADREQPR